ncbi:hypothetical protein [Fusobacterium gonidiaformans]|uniref:hypothetical protein n=1 Tax=Fusobacterium gonidiaformans TaxID=849 RepID=UPI0001BC67D8|nr:hypothetical protein [Fusobacterium gonidiaformans]KMV76185.1 hypothetical protein FGAG_01670 [Fusobacterium gonidiaformans ATCC 25563]
MMNVSNVMEKVLLLIYRLDTFFFRSFCHEAPVARKTNVLYPYFQEEKLDKFFHAVTHFGEGYLEFFWCCYSFSYFYMIKRSLRYAKNML